MYTGTALEDVCKTPFEAKNQGMLIPIQEIFVSLEGEGPDVGTPTLFIRVAGCDFKCPWCDTKESWSSSRKAQSLDEILTKVCFLLKVNTGVRRVSITGGNPSLYKGGCRELFSELARSFKRLTKFNLEHPGIHPSLLDEDEDDDACDLFIERERNFFKDLHRICHPRVVLSISMDVKLPLWRGRELSCALHHSRLMAYMHSSWEEVTEVAVKVLVYSVEDVKALNSCMPTLMNGVLRSSQSWWVGVIRNNDNSIDKRVVGDLMCVLSANDYPATLRLNPNLHVQLGIK